MITANGATVTINAAATRARAASGLMLKKIDPASAAVTSPSPTDDAAWMRANHMNGVGASDGLWRSGRLGRFSGRHPGELAVTGSC